MGDGTEPNCLDHPASPAGAMALARAPRDVAAALAWLDTNPAPPGPVDAVLVAVDRFDLLNAIYGRRVGDQVLAALAARLERVATDQAGPALAARIGGSEYLVAGAAGTAERVGRVLADPMVIDGAPIPVETSLAPGRRVAGETGAALLARLRGGGRASGIAPDGEGPDALAADLHRAIEGREVQVLFQPQVSLASGRIVGVEALARWEHPRLGTLGAEPLFAAAARAGLAGILSAHVQELALRRASRWTGMLAGLRLSVNVTPGDLAEPGFVSRFLDRLRGSGFPAGRLTVEITESGLIAELDAAAASLARVRAAGAQVALDDFGTGYSSLAWLRALPVDTIKLDKAITRDVTGSPRDRAVLDGIVGIAQRLELHTVAEGVETAEQRDLLAAAGCDLYQGFLCAEALDEPALAALLEMGDA